MYKILMIMTSASRLGKNGEATGVWLEELTTPYYVFKQAGANVDLASINGGPVPIDPRSVQAKGKNPPTVERFLVDHQLSNAVKASKAIKDVDIAHYDAIFLPGGHGTMVDFPQSERLANLLGQAWRQGKVLAAVCHGPAGLLGVRDETGEPVVKGRMVTGFSNHEEHAVGLQNVVPFLLEDRLRELGGHYDSKADFQAFALADGRLVTGQNPASSALTARIALDTLAKGSCNT